ncbi:UNVERIFIED_CONTAM: hypothetical protein GTU68_050539, partial [Idotea baltica]|nr:hypothetical protein [Idotea baltica]
MTNTRVRIPPSPTGLLHLGTARTALFNYLFAKKQSGEIVFRWEDTDRERSKTEFETDILDGLTWLGMNFVKESVGVFRQSDRLSDHKVSLAKMWEEETIFPCFCTPEEVDLMREEAKQKKVNFVFWSPCRDKERAESEKLMKEKPFVWRLRCPKGRDIVFKDLIRGDITVNTDTIGDFAVARVDDSVLYPLANVLDDIDQKITHVLRGEDGISNTPKQLLLFEALGAKAPEYGHIPLVLDEQKRKLSKRNVEPGTCVLIDDFRQQGFLPEAVLNGLAFLGWNPKSEIEIFDKEALIQAF